MCLLIHQPKGLTFSKHDLKDYLSYNGDGFGMMFGDGRRLRVFKGLGTDKELMEMYYRYAAGREAVLHFRMKTHGPVSTANVHPFLVTNKIGMAHNGILSIGNPKDPKKTDTYHLIEYFIAPVARRNPDWLFDPVWCEMLGDLIGNNNKLAFCHADGRISLVNGAHGVKHKGAWLSNEYAWSAPGKYKGYSSSGWSKFSGWEDDDGIDWAARYNRNASMGGSQSVTTKRDDEDVADIAGWASQMAEVYRSGQEQGLMNWVEKYPSRAEAVIHDFYEYTKEEVHELVDKYPAVAVEVLQGIIDAMTATIDGPDEDEVPEEPSERYAG